VTVRENPEQDQESLRQLNLIYSGLIGIGVVWVQPFLTAPSLDLSATICVVAFSVAIPLLAALVALNWQESFRRRMAKSATVTIAQVVAQTCAFIGVVAGFWHILWVAGVGMLAGGLVAVAVHSTGYWRLERDRLRTPQGREQPGDTEA
jgi:O-antigen/teichoic acid export membrane protein